MPDPTIPEQHHVADLMSKAKVAMLTTTTADGRIVSGLVGLEHAVAGRNTRVLP